MDRTHAQRILLTYRLGEAAPPGSELAEALSLAERDPELEVWLEDQLRYDRQLRSGFRGISPPPGLRDSILRGRPPAADSGRRHRAALLALAAVLALAVGAGLLRMRRPAAGGGGGSARVTATAAPTFREQMTAFVAEGRYVIQAQAGSLAELRQFIGKNGGADDAVVPAPVAALGTYGCQVLDWEGQRVTLICFTSPRLGFVHLVVLDAPPGAGIGNSPAMALVGGWNTAVWGRGGKTYLLCAQGSDADLRSLLGS